MHVLGQVPLFTTRWTVALQSPLSLGVSRQEYCSGLSFPSPWNFSHLGFKPQSPASSELAGEFFTSEPAGTPIYLILSDKHSGLHTYTKSLAYLVTTLVPTQLGQANSLNFSLCLGTVWSPLYSSHHHSLNQYPVYYVNYWKCKNEKACVCH